MGDVRVAWVLVGGSMGVASEVKSTQKEVYGKLINNAVILKIGEPFDTHFEEDFIFEIIRGAVLGGVNYTIPFSVFSALVFFGGGKGFLFETSWIWFKDELTLSCLAGFFIHGGSLQRFTDSIRSRDFTPLLFLIVMSLKLSWCSFNYFVVVGIIPNRSHELIEERGGDLNLVFWSLWTSFWARRVLK